MSIKWRMDKQGVVYSYDELLLNNEKEQTIDPFDIYK